MPANQKPKRNSNTGNKPIPWVDVGDDDDSLSKKSLKRKNAMLNNHDLSKKRKRQRFSNSSETNSSPGLSNGHNSTSDEPKAQKRKALNGAGPSSLSPKAAVLLEQRRQLPIAQGRDALMDEIRANDVTVLLGETGSGKTTQVPQYLLEHGLAGTGTIAVTQPRKVAATSLASRVSNEQNTPLGHLIGYSVRFDEKSSNHTRIKYMTDGMIVRELLSDPLLSKYSVVIVDEAHERTLRTDLLMANLKSIQKERNVVGEQRKGKGKSNPLKIVVMSATLDAEKFSKFFDNAKILYVKGRQHPVKIYHSVEPQPDYIDSAMRTFFQIHTDQPPGDVLIFLPGQEDIESLEKSIEMYANRLPQSIAGVFLVSMYAAQAPGKNAKAFSATPKGMRKCILATNIAETSITIPGVKYVIDTGKCKEKRYLAKDNGGGFDTLLTKDITKSSAMQRAGRAGREGMGVCFRLYTEDAFNNMELSAEPEIMRVSLTASMLQLKCLNQDLEELDLMDKPDQDSIMSALKTLWLLKAIDDKAKLTPLGKQMAAFPLEPTHARAVLASTELGCTSEMLTIISVLSASSKLFLDLSSERSSIASTRQKFRHPSGDHMTILNTVRAYQEIAAAESKNTRREWCKKHFLNERALLEARDIREQLQQVCSRLGIDSTTSCGENEDPVVRSLGFGLTMNSALLQPDGSYKQTMGQSVIKIHPGSVLAEKKVPAIIYDELVYTNQIYARGVSAIPKSFFIKHDALSKRTA